jgi:hypothetical protein
MEASANSGSWCCCFSTSKKEPPKIKVEVVETQGPDFNLLEWDGSENTKWKVELYGSVQEIEAEWAK